MEKKVLPACIGIIMDGNRRWAKAQGLAPWEGHTEGYKKFKEVLRWAKDTDIRNVIVYAFSTENWKRSEEEVGHILSLFRHFLKNELEELIQEKVRVRFAGERERFPEDIQALMREAEEKTSTFTERTVVVAASYGGRAEILKAAEALRTTPGALSEDMFERALSTAGFPDPDLIIRTGGEMRLSNFLPWQSVYSELFFLKTEWPAFSKEAFGAILNEYAKRKRNFGA